MKFTLLLSSLLVLGGCASTQPEVINYKFPANLTTPCEKLPLLKGDTLGDLYKYTIEVTAIYNECALRHDALSKAVKTQN